MFFKVKKKVKKDFKDKKFLEVVQSVDENFEALVDEHLYFFIALEIKLYYLLSAFELSELELNEAPTHCFIQEVDEAFITLLINEAVDDGWNDISNFGNHKNYHETKPLYIAFKIKTNICALSALLHEKSKRNQLDFLPPFDTLYKNTKKFLENPCLHGHFLYDELLELFKKFQQDLDKEYEEIKLAQEKDLQVHVESLTQESFNKWFNNNYMNRDQLYRLKTSSEHCKKLISYTNNYLQLPEHEPSKNSHKLLIRCYFELNEFSSALKQVEASLELHEKLKKTNLPLFETYLLCMKNLDKKITDENIETFNTFLASHFRYSLFLCKNRDSLFKYYPFNENTLDALLNQYFYLASKEQLNDPLELPYDSLQNAPTTEKNIPRMYIKDHFKISSFSNNKNSTLMWSHYAENHTGLMVEYCFNDYLPTGVGIAKVSYVSSFKRAEKKEDYLFNQYVLIKDREWHYEQEVRLFAYKKDKVYYESIASSEKCVDKANAYIKSITLGYKFPEGLIELMRNIVSTLNAKYKKDGIKESIILRKAKLDENNCFNLKYDDITCAS